MAKRERIRGDTEVILNSNDANDHGQQLSNSSSLFQLKRRRLRNSTSSSTEPDNSDDPSASSCCSSNVSSEYAKEKLSTNDFQEVCSGVDEVATWGTFIIEQTQNAPSETTLPSKLQAGFSELESTTAPPSSASSLNRSTEAKKPSDDELDNFFSSAERKLHKQFSNKYNFDFGKEEPLEGRYEWIQVKP